MAEKSRNSLKNTPKLKKWAQLVIAALLLVVLILGGLLFKQYYEAQSHLTQANFNSIELSHSEGDSLTDVTELFSAKPTTVTQTDKKGVTTQVAVWKDVVDAQKNSRIYVYFDDGHAVTKTIKGLKRDRKHIISRHDFNRLKVGMKKGEVARQIGTPNDYTFNERLPGVSNEQWTYIVTKTDKQAAGVMTLSFNGGRLTDKAQNNLK